MRDWLTGGADPASATRRWWQRRVFADRLTKALHHRRRAHRDLEELRLDPRAAGRLDALEARQERANADARRLLDEAMALGLELRLGKYLREPVAYEIFNALLNLGGHIPQRVAVCWTCHLVFRPERKAHAWKCPDCHAGHAPPGISELPDGGVWVQFGPSARVAHGLVSRGHRPCRICDEYFTANRRDQVYCSNACNNRGYRRRLTGEPERDEEHTAEWWGTAEGEARIDVEFERWRLNTSA